MSEVKLTRSEYDKMQRQIAKLEALEAGGVDNWERYSESLKEWFAENELDEAMDDCLDGINEVLVTADIYEPSERGAGYAVDYDPDEMKKVLAGLIAEALRIHQEQDDL